MLRNKVFDVKIKVWYPGWLILLDDSNRESKTHGLGTNPSLGVRFLVIVSLGLGSWFMARVGFYLVRLIGVAARCRVFVIVAETLWSNWHLVVLLRAFLVTL